MRHAPRVVAAATALSLARCTPFGSADGATGLDASADGDRVGDTVPSAVPCSSIELDGRTSFAEIAAGGMRFDFDSFTIEAWALVLENLPNASTEMHLIAHDNYDSSDGFLLGVSDGVVDARVYSGSINQGEGWYAKGPTISRNAWHHIAFVYDASRRRAAVFLDGVGDFERGEVAKADAYSGPMRFGSSAYAKHFYFHGRLDEARVMNEVAYSGGGFTPPYPLPDDAPGTVGTWHFSEGRGTTSAESKGRDSMGANLQEVTWSADCARTP